MNNREMLLKQVQMYDFVLNDAALYLDTHPNDKNAQDYYKKHLQMRNSAANEYTAKYGPLLQHDFDGANSWRWVDSPWPWQLEEDL